MRVLFVGELFPSVAHGVSISNFINCETLRRIASVDQVEEYTTIDKIGFFSLQKIKKIIKYCNEIRVKSKNQEYDFFYFSLSLSFLGVLKNILYLLSLKKDNCKVITHLHRGDFELFYSYFWRRIVFNYLAKKIDKIICLSPQHLNTVSSLLTTIGVEAVYVKNTILDEKNYLTIFQRRKRAVVLKKIHNVLFLSNYLVEKGILDIIAVAGQAPELKFNLYGAFNDNERFLRSIAPKNVNIYGPISREEKASVFKRNSVLVFPSWNEGQPLVLLEAMASGLPIIATSVGLIPDLLGKKYPYLVKPKQPSSILKALQKINDSNDLKNLSISLQKKYVREHSAKIHSEKLLKVFKN